jgi:hypothetical protein
MKDRLMPIKTTCPGCGLTCTAPDHLHGRTIQCKRCSTAFAIGSRAQLHEDVNAPAAPAPLIPPPQGGLGLAPLPRAPWYKRMKSELIGAGILAIIILVSWVIIQIVRSRW